MVEIFLPDPTVNAIWEALSAQAQGTPRTEAVNVPVHLLGSECDLAIFLTHRWASPPERRDGKGIALQEQAALDKGTLISALALAGVHVEVASDDRGSPWRFSLFDGAVQGRCDGLATGVVEAPKAVHALMCKSLTAANFRAVKKHGLEKALPEHWHGLHGAIHGTAATRGLYIALNRDDRDILIERIRPDDAVLARQGARIAGIVDTHHAPPGLLLGLTEAQTEAARKRPPCRYCPHQGRCFDAAMPRMHCRTCAHFSFTAGGHGHCAHLDKPLTPLEQRDGAICPTHLHLPDLIPGEQIDADPEAMTITYRMVDGSTWTDGPVRGEE
jgi:hypothetical protein